MVPPERRALSVRLGKLYGYANCKGDEDTGNGFYQGMRGQGALRRSSPSTRRARLKRRRSWRSTRTR